MEERVLLPALTLCTTREETKGVLVQVSDWANEAINDRRLHCPGDPNFEVSYAFLVLHTVPGTTKALFDALSVHMYT